jgi:hypothetical protein
LYSTNLDKCYSLKCYYIWNVIPSCACHFCILAFFFYGWIEDHN